MKPHLFNSAPVRLKTYKSDHDQGSGSLDAASGRITPLRHWSNYWAWWALRHGALAGLTPVFAIAKDRHFNPVAGERLAVWGQSPDSDVWTDFDNLAVGAADITFSHNTPFPRGKIYLAALPMYPFSRVARMVNAWRQDARVSSPPSAQDGVIAYATRREAGDGSGRTAPALPFYALKISSGGTNPKNKAILAAYNHPSETQGPFALEGAVAWLLGGSPAADFLLEHTDFYIYPCLNPQGVFCGYFRSCPEDASLDHNRQWLTAGALECIDVFKAAMLADTDGAIEMGIDFHGWMDSWAVKGYSYDKTAGLVPYFRTAMIALDAAYDTVSDAAVNTRLETLWKNSYAAPLAITQEMGCDVGRSVADWKAYGANSLKALGKLLAEGRFSHGPAVGSRNFNGSTNRLDWPNPADLTGSALTVSAWVNSDGYAAPGDYVVCIHTAGDSAAGIVLSLVAGNQIQLLRHGSTDLYRYGSGASLAGAWRHILATHAGAINDAAAIHLYIDGAECSSYAGVNGAAEIAPAGSLSLGGRIYDDARNLDGKLAQAAVWNRVLTASERAALAAGLAPQLAAPAGLVFYWKGNTESLADEVSAANASADGSNQLSGAGNGPGIVY